MSALKAVRVLTFFGFNSIFPGAAMWFIVNVVMLYSIKSTLDCEMGPSFKPTVWMYIASIVLIFSTAFLGIIAFFVNKPKLYLSVR